MGNTELKAAFKTALKGSDPGSAASQKLGLTAEILLEDQFVQQVGDYIKKKLSVDAIDNAKAFPDASGNVQTVENAGELYKRQLMSQLNENYMTGFATAESNIEFLKDPSFEKYFTVNTPESISDYSKLQQQKFVILYALFVEKYKEQQDKKTNFFEYIQRFLDDSAGPDQSVSPRVQVGLESGFKFSLSLLKEIKNINKDMLVNSLEYLFQTLRYAEPGALYSTDKLSFMIDSNLNDARSFLVSLIQENLGAFETNKRVIELAFKVILLLGIVRSNVEDLLIVATLLDNPQVSVDLRSELNILIKQSGVNSQDEGIKKIPKFGDKKVTKNGIIFFLQAGKHKQQIKRSASFAVDTEGQYIYMHQEELGLVKMGTGAQGQMIGQVFKHLPDYRKGEQISLLKLNNILYCRAESLKPKPFVRLNLTTLEEEAQEEFELEKEDKNLEWKTNFETGRSLTYTPLFSDGQNIYVISRHWGPKDPKTNEEGQKKQKKTPMFVVEIFDSSSTEFKFVREVPLYKNEELEPFIKQKNSVKFLKASSFATNGQVLMIQSWNRIYFFDLKTGIRVQKGKTSDFGGVNHDNCKVVYDFQNNLFYSFKYETAETKLESFTITNFKKVEFISGFAKEYLQKRINQVKQVVYGDEMSNDQSDNEDPTQLNLIQRIMKNVTTPELIDQSRNETEQFRIPNQDQFSKYQKTLILEHIYKSCQNFDFKMNEVLSQRKTASELEQSMMTFFKFPNATYLTHTVFKQIEENLDRLTCLIDAKKTSQNLSESYCLYFILKILTANFKALAFCSISLPDIMNKNTYQRFLKAYRECIVKIIEKGYTQDFEEGNEQKEQKALWDEIYKMCLSILSSSINLIFSDIKDIAQSLADNLKNITDEKQAENSSISLNYLSQPENAKKLLQGEAKDLKLVTEVFELCCSIRGSNLAKVIVDTKLDESHYIIKSSNISESSNKFIKNLSEQLIVFYCSLTESLAVKSQVASSHNSEREERDKQRLKDFDVLIETIFRKSAQEIQNQILSLRTSLQASFQARNATSVDSTEQSGAWDKINEKYEKYSAFVDQVLEFDSAFIQVVNLYIQAFGVFKIKTGLIPSICQSCISIVAEISAFYQLMNQYSKKVSTFSGDKDRIKQFFDKFSRSLCWFVGLTAYQLINVKEDKDQEKQNEEKKEAQTQVEDDKMHDLIIQSNLLSGGIDNRFLYLFSQDVQTELKDLIKISNDYKIIELLNAQAEPDDDNLVFSQIIHQGQNEMTDRLIGYLQGLLEKKMPIPNARLFGSDGMRLCRAAFAVMIKFSDLQDSIVTCLDEIDVLWHELEGNIERNLKIKEALKLIPNFDLLLKRWESAWKMRNWIMEKKKNLSERIRKEVEVEFKKKKDEQAQDAPFAAPTTSAGPETPASAEEPHLNVDEVELIDTSSKKPSKKNNTAAQEQQAKPDASGLTEIEKEEIEKIADEKFNTELKSIFTKIVEKAEFLIKLQVPMAYLFKDPQKKKEGTLLIIKDQKIEDEDNVGELNQEDHKNWINRLKSWRQMQTSKGAIKSFTERNKEIFESSVMSILACLQTAINAEKIQKQVETVFLNGAKRVAGLKLLGHLFNFELPKQHRYDLMSWFCGSLRGNKNPHLAHYLDGLKGCGLHLEELARENFFEILKGMVNQLKDSKDIDEIKVIINSLKWKYLARDHHSLFALNLFKVLHQGDGKADHKLKTSWGRPLNQEVVSSEKDKKLSNGVIDLFEQVFLHTVGRIIKPDTGAHIKLKQRGTAVPTLEKAQSRIDENVSEHLIGSAFEVIFKEFERYINIMNSFKGVDWTVYVKMRNKDRKDNEYQDEKLFDEEPQEEEQSHPIAEEEFKDQPAAEKEQKNEDSKSQKDSISNKIEELKGQIEDKKEEDKEDNIEEKEKQEAIKKREERAKKQMNSINKLYSESFLRRLLRLVEIFTSIATVSQYPLSMVQRVANPYQLQTLLHLLILSSPRIKIVVLKIIQNLIKIAIPFEVFEETITIIARDPRSKAYEILTKVIPSVQIDESKFLKFLYNYLLSIRHKMWIQSGIESEGQYAVTQEISEIFKTALCNKTLAKVVHPDPSHSHHEKINFRVILEKKMREVLGSMNQLNIEEADAWLNFLPGCEFQGIRTGQWVLTPPPSNQKVLVIGYSKNYIRDAQFEEAKKEDVQNISLSMKFQCKSKAICMYEQKGLIEIIEADPSTLSQIDHNPNIQIDGLQVLDEKNIMMSMISSLTKGRPKNFNSLSYLEKLKTESLKCQIIKIIEFQIRARGQQYVDLMIEHGLFNQFVDYLFQKSSNPIETDPSKPQRTEQLLEAKCFLLRQKAMETRESLNSENTGIIGLIQNNKYIVIQGIIDGIMSFPISGCINIEANIRSPILKVTFLKDIMSLNEAFEMLIVTPDDFTDGKRLSERTFKAIHKARIIITSDQIRALDIFIMMRKLENAHPKGQFAGLSEKIVIQIEKEDFAKLFNPKSVTVPDFKVSKKDSTVGILVKLLKNWGNCPDQMLDYLQNCDLESPAKIQQTLVKALNPDSFNELLNQQRIQQHILDNQEEEEKESDMLFSSAISGGSLKQTLSFKQSLSFKQINEVGNESLKQEDLLSSDLDIKPLDLMANNQVKKRLQYYMEKYILPLDEVKKVQNQSLTENTYEKVQASVQELKGKALMKEYYETIEKFRILKTRETFISLIQNGDIEKILPMILSSEDKRQKFSDFVKISYNEAKKQHSARSKNLVSFIKNILQSIVKKAKLQDEDCIDYIHTFFLEDIVKNGFKGLQATTTTETGALISIIQNIYYKEEELAVKYANPSLFRSLTKTILSSLPDFLSNHPVLLSDLLTLSLAYALHLADFATKNLEQYLQLALELVYFALNNLPTLNPASIENLLSNSLALHVCESLKNIKSNDKSQDCQRILTELYVQMMNIKDRVEERRQQKIECCMRVNKYLNSMKKMDRVIRDLCAPSGGGYEYLQYLEFIKSSDKDFLRQLNKVIETEHKMYDAPFKSHIKVKNCKRLKITVSKKSRFPPFTEMAITSDEKGEHVMEIVAASEENKDDQKFDFYTNEFYVHYPAKRPQMIGFGSQKFGKLGTGKNGGETSFINIPISLKINVKEVFARQRFSVIIDQENQVYLAGQIKQTTERTKFTHLPLPNEVNLELISVGNSSILVMGTDQKFYWMGRTKQKLYKDQDENQDKFVAMQSDCAPRLTNGKICQIATGSKFCLFVTDKGQLYARGKLFLDTISLPVLSTATLVTLPEYMIVKKAYVTVGAKDQPVAMIDVLDKSENRRRKILSAGKNRFGVLGLGDDVKHQKEFKDIKINFGLVQIIDIQMTATHAMAITKEGTVYGWGRNQNMILGLGNEETHSSPKDKIFYTPTPIEFFEKYNIKAIRCGENHNLVYAKKTKGTKELEQYHLFSLGKPLTESDYPIFGITKKNFEETKNKFGPWKIAKFEDCKILSLAAGQSTSLIFTQTPKEVNDMKMHKVGEKEYEEGILHFYPDEKGKIVIIPPSQYEKERSKLPPICYATKYPIKKIEEKEFPDLSPLMALLKPSEGDIAVHEGVSCNRTNESIRGVRYFGTLTKSSSKNQRKFNYSEESFFKVNDSDIDPIIYIRFSQSIDNSTDLPALDPTKYFSKNDDAWGMEISVQPDYRTDISLEVIDFQAALYNDKLFQMLSWDPEKINLLKEFINSLPLASDKDFIQEAFKIIKERRTQYMALGRGASEQSIQAVIDLKYKCIVESVDDDLKLIQSILDMQSKFLARFMNIVSMRRMPSSLQERLGWNLFIPTVKKEMLAHQRKKVLNKMISSLPETGEGSVKILRRKAFYFANSGEMDNEGKFTIFGQAFQQLRKDQFQSFKKTKVDAKVFSVTFAGEGAQDAGGPFRDCITNMCKELQSASLPILIKTANNKNNHGQYRECWIPNPSSKSPTQLEMFVFFGAMVGWSIRSTSSLNLDLPPIFWKKILGQEVDEWDLKIIDTYSWQIVQDLKKYQKSESKKDSAEDQSLLDEQFNYAVDQSFVTLLSDGSEFELCHNGRAKKVTRENLEEYLKLLIKTRLHEFDVQMKSIKEGINLIIPDSILFFMSWQDLDLRSTGSKTIEVSTLQSVTVYSSCQVDHPMVKMFWNVFKTFTEEQRSLYLKYVWGRSRLPMNLQDISRKHQIEYFKGRTKDSLPHAHTCFFTIDLPDYSSEEIMKKRLLYAIQYCGDIDADRGAHDIAAEE